MYVQEYMFNSSYMTWSTWVHEYLGNLAKWTLRKSEGDL